MLYFAVYEPVRPCSLSGGRDAQQVQGETRPPSAQRLENGRETGPVAAGPRVDRGSDAMTPKNDRSGQARGYQTWSFNGSLPMAEPTHISVQASL